MLISFDAGDMTIHRIVEMEISWDAALEFFPALIPEVLAENRAWMQPAALDADDHIILCFQSYLVRTPHHTILVDSCVGNGKSRPDHPVWDHNSDRQYMDTLARAGLRVDDIDFVLCTHLHSDHVGWNTRLEDGRWVPTFPNARYLFSEKELGYWTEQTKKSPVACIVDSVLPIVAAQRADLITNTHELGDHLRLMPTPGHTIDHFSVELGHGSAEAVISGDCLHSPLQARYPHMNMARDFNPDQAASSRRAFLERYCDTTTHCCFSHFPSPSVGKVKRWGDGFQCDYAD